MKVTKGHHGIQDNNGCVSFSGDKLRHTHRIEERKEEKMKDIKWFRIGERKERQQDKSENSRQAASV
jgi:hypothetical protein